MAEDPRTSGIDCNEATEFAVKPGGLVVRKMDARDDVTMQVEPDGEAVWEAGSLPKERKRERVERESRARKCWTE